MKNTHKTNTLLVIVTVFILASSIFLANNAIGFDSVANLSRNNSFIPSAITVDGSLLTGEWDAAAYVEEWYIDADVDNTDGYNYMYLAEDANYLYVALDLCSDTTNDGTGEWVGVWLNTNQTQFCYETWEEPTEWAAALNNGAESLVYDVEKDQPMAFFDDKEVSTKYLYAGNWYEVNGTLDNYQEGILIDDNDYLNITSEFNGTHYISRMDYYIDFHDYFKVFADLLIDKVYVVFVGIRSQHNVTVDEHFMSVSDENGNLNPLLKEDLGTGTSEVFNVVQINPENFTSETKVILSMNTINDAPFNTSYDYNYIYFNYNRTSDIGQYSAYPYSTIQSYDIEWSFGPSENNATDHRQFEIKIPKTELEGYETETDLGIIVGGYGTLVSFPNTNNWVYANGTDMYLPEESSIYYNYYSMPLKGQVITTPTSTTGTTSATTSTSTTTSSTGGGGIDPSLYLIIGGVGAAVVVVVIILIMVRKK